MPKKPTPDQNGKLTCEEPGCATPRGNRQRGFTRQGLSNHFNKKHRPLIAESVTEMPPNGVREDVMGTPGATVVMGEAITLDAQSFMEDVRNVVGVPSTPQWTENDNVPVAALPSEEGPAVHIKARGGMLFVDLGEGWEEWDLEQFISNVRFAVRIS